MFTIAQRDVHLGIPPYLRRDTGSQAGGVVAPYDTGLAVVPARTLLAAAERLLEAPQKVPVDLGIEVDRLTPRLAVAAGAETGVVVTWVNPAGVAAEMLRVGDVIQAVDGMSMTTPEAWRVRAARVGVGDIPNPCPRT